jgi:hypothetical protein
MKYLVASIGLVFLLFQTSCSTQRAIANYSGDGEIFAMPDGGFVQGGGGYQVRFKRVRLDHPAHFTYHFTGLPKDGWHVEVYFAIEDPQERLWNDSEIKDLKGTLAMSLKDTNGHVILEFRHKLSEFTWCRAGANPPGLYDFSNSGFITDPRKQYILEVNIEPDAILKDDEGYVMLRSGGHEGFSL